MLSRCCHVGSAFRIYSFIIPSLCLLSHADGESATLQEDDLRILARLNFPSAPLRYTADKPGQMVSLQPHYVTYAENIAPLSQMAKNMIHYMKFDFTLPRRKYSIVKTLCYLKADEIHVVSLDIEELTANRTTIEAVGVRLVVDMHVDMSMKIFPLPCVKGNASTTIVFEGDVAMVVGDYYRKGSCIFNDVKVGVLDMQFISPSGGGLHIGKSVSSHLASTAIAFLPEVVENSCEEICHRFRDASGLNSYSDVMKAYNTSLEGQVEMSQSYLRLAIATYCAIFVALGFIIGCACMCFLLCVRKYWCTPRDQSERQFSPVRDDLHELVGQRTSVHAGV